MHQVFPSFLLKKKKSFHHSTIIQWTHRSLQNHVNIYLFESWNYCIFVENRSLPSQLSKRTVKVSRKWSKCLPSKRVFHPWRHQQRRMTRVQPFLVELVSQREPLCFGSSLWSGWCQVWDTHRLLGGEPRPMPVEMGCNPFVLPFQWPCQIPPCSFQDFGSGTLGDSIEQEWCTNIISIILHKRCSFFVSSFIRGNSLHDLIENKISQK